MLVSTTTVPVRLKAALLLAPGRECWPITICWSRACLRSSISSLLLICGERCRIYEVAKAIVLVAGWTIGSDQCDIAIALASELSGQNWALGLDNDKVGGRFGMALRECNDNCTC